MFQRRGSRVRDTWLLSGWLFADLLLALMMIFLISINGGNPPPRPCATPASAFNARKLASLPGQASEAAVPRATPTPCSSPTPTPTPTPVICGLDLKHPVDLTFPVNDPTGLRGETPSGKQSFDSQVQSKFASYATQTAGLVEVFGGGVDVSIGEPFALNAVHALVLLENQHFIFDSQRTVFQNYWDGRIGDNHIRMYVLFYQQSSTGCA